MPTGDRFVKRIENREQRIGNREQGTGKIVPRLEIVRAGQMFGPSRLTLLVRLTRLDCRVSS